ncbi:MAG: SMP-30/gluconolactonase/LRE family protein [Hyphomicrobiales bacterium]|nr:SMP-30/gluconolactonase/LRE family protein [Hyphomicrobiales bacterium]MCP4997909.1 SMP-30/gluconolactonase/LRE family protein [Hyphomicrobiales bacterium]
MFKLLEADLIAELIYPAKDIVGESLVWDYLRKRLLWVDIIGKTIHAFDPVAGNHREWDTPDFVTSIGLRKDGGAIVAFTKTICLWDYGDEFTQLAAVEPDRPGNRLNEGVVGPDGAFWCGTMQNNIAPDGQPLDITEDAGQLYRCTSDGQLIRLSNDLFGISNTFIWTDDGCLITADTLKNEIYRYAVDPETGRLSDRRIILSNFKRGLPDGSAIDAKGFIWNCRVVGGSCLVRFRPGHRIESVIDLPCSWPTSCAFGGDKLDTLFVTSARFTMEDEHLQAHPQEGGLYAVRPGVTGLPCHRFG